MIDPNPEAQHQVPSDARGGTWDLLFNLGNTFETFFAGKSYNPLFLFGDMGLGKIHWLQAGPRLVAVMSQNCHKGALGLSREFFTGSPFWKEP